MKSSLVAAKTPVEDRPLLPTASLAGFVLTNASLDVMACNAEAIRILSYPNPPGNIGRPGRAVAEQLRSKLLSLQPPAQSSFATELRSGRRLYHCRAFNLDYQAGSHEDPVVALLLERSFSMSALLPQVFGQFNLTPRERQAAELLLQGLASKEIAQRMNISPNTVKAFLRLIMIKMGASSRTGIIGRIVSASQPRG